MRESKYSEYDNEILELWNDGNGINKMEIATHLKKKYKLDVSINALEVHLKGFLKNHFIDKEIVEQNVRLAKGKQKAQDNNRIANKSFREYARVENALEEYVKSIQEQNKTFAAQLSKVKFPKYKANKGGTGIIQITDTHGNELIDLPHNKYDFNVLAKRLKKHISESLNYFEYRGVNKVLIAFTGDLLNSDRRLDELLGASTNRAKATVLMIHVFKQAICDVAMKYPVSIVSVVGNESRVNKEMTFSNEALSDNYDFTIIAQLKQIFEFANVKNVHFKGYDKVREVVDFGEQKWLLSHNISGTVDSQQKTQSEIGMYSLMGHKIDFCIGGHIHATRITDISARSASMAGSNSYNENALGLIGRASHNCYVVKGKERFIQVNDIQDVDNVEGYEVISQLEAYNAKSNSKIHKSTAILQIII